MEATMKGADIKGIMNRLKSELITDSSEMLDKIGMQVVYPSIEKTFEVEGRPVKWQELSPRTQRQRRWNGFGASHPILVQYGELKDASTKKDAFGADYKLDKTKLTISNYLEKGKALHFGDGLIPARPFFMLQDEDTKKAQDVVFKHITKQLQKIVAEEKL